MSRRILQIQRNIIVLYSKYFLRYICSNSVSIQLHWSSIKENKRVVKLYTGCSSAKIFDFIVAHVRTKHRKLKYYKGSDSVSDETKQFKN